jgi:putative MATE family efflux protein
MKAQQHVHDLEHAKIGRLMWKFFLPAFAGMIANSLYNVVDRIYIGQGVDALALSGITVIFPLMIIFMAFGMLIGMGSAVRISLSLGEKDLNKANRILGNAAFLNLLIGIVIMIIGFILKKPALRLFGAGPETMKYASDYYSIILAGVPFGMMGFSLNNIIRAEGNAKTAMLSMFISAGINIILDPVFIFVLHMGVKGAAIATIFSQFVLCVWVIAHFRGKKSVVKLHWVNMKPDKAIILYILSIGFAPFSMQIASSIVNGLMNTQLIKFGGDIAVGAMGIVNSITILLVMSIISINMATQPIVGFNYGAGNHCRVKEAVLLAVKYAFLIATGGWILCMFFPGTLINIFNSKSIELREVGIQGLRIYCSVLPVVGYQIIASSYFQAIGKAKLATFISMLRQVIVLLPLLIIMPHFWGISGVWIANPVSDFIAAAISFLFFRKELKKLKCDIPEKDEEPLSVPATTY